jgi:hypothetical protein
MVSFITMQNRYQDIDNKPSMTPVNTFIHQPAEDSLYYKSVLKINNVPHNQVKMRPKAHCTPSFQGRFNGVSDKKSVNLFACLFVIQLAVRCTAELW